MRIISGKFKGKILRAPAFDDARPTTDFAKTGLFNILSNRYDFDKVKVLDLFAGSGSITFEFLSRGAVYVTCVEKNAASVRFITKTLNELHFENCSVVKSDVFSFILNYAGSFDIIFADPPFSLENKDELIHLVFENNTLTEKGVFILEHQSKTHFAEHPNFVEERKYGNVTFSFFTSKK